MTGAPFSQQKGWGGANHMKLRGLTCNMHVDHRLHLSIYFWIGMEIVRIMLTIVQKCLYFADRNGYFSIPVYDMFFTTPLPSQSPHLHKHKRICILNS